MSFHPRKEALLVEDVPAREGGGHVVLLATLQTDRTLALVA